MKFNRKIIAVALAVVVLTAIGAVSQSVKRAHMHGDGMFGGGMFGGGRFMTRYLDLTDAQQAQVKDILSKEKPTIQPLMQQLAQSRQQERALVEAGTFDETQARTLATQRSQVQTTLAVEKMRVESELYQVLNSDQKAKLNAFLDKHAQRFSKQTQAQPESSEQ